MNKGTLLDRGKQEARKIRIEAEAHMSSVNRERDRQVDGRYSALGNSSVLRLELDIGVNFGDFLFARMRWI